MQFLIAAKRINLSFLYNRIYSDISHVQGLILCNPNNPLGSVISEQDLLGLINACTKLKLPIIIDEAYYEYYGKTCAHILENNDNLIIIRSFSKYYGLAGIRLGYIMANPYLIEQMKKFAGHGMSIVLQYC